jgi:hypothetical protein
MRYRCGRRAGFGTGAPLATDNDPFRSEQGEFPVDLCRQSMNVKICVDIVGSFHDRGRRGHDRNAGAFPYPVDVPVPVHHHDPAT